VTLSDSPAHVDGALRALLSEAIDYAGLFPPAQLDMPGAVAEYASYLGSPDAWALGRFVVPASRLEELAEVGTHDAAESARSLGTRPVLWRLSVLLGADVATDLARMHRFDSTFRSAREGWSARVEAVEVRGSSPDAVAAAMRAVPEELDRYVEIPIDGDPTALVRAIGAAGAYAKVRTGGTSPDAFPVSDDLVRFLVVCVRHGVPFKATAGLHHPLRGEYPLTYEPNAAAGRMYGFLNVFLASAFLKEGMSAPDARQLLEEQDAASVRFDRSGVAWRGHRLGIEQLLAARTMVKSFGSCSFREPIDDLGEIGLL